VVDHVKVDLMPGYDYEEFDRKQAEWESTHQNHQETTENEDMAW
jgi:hypothetical protein